MKRWVVIGVTGSTGTSHHFAGVLFVAYHRHAHPYRFPISRRGCSTLAPLDLRESRHDSSIRQRCLALFPCESTNSR